MIIDITGTILIPKKEKRTALEMGCIRKLNVAVKNATKKM